MVHTLGVGEAAFDWRGRLPSNQRQVDNAGDAGDEEEDAVCDKSLFIEPVQWMTGAINQLDGKVQNFYSGMIPLFCIMLVFLYVLI